MFLSSVWGTAFAAIKIAVTEIGPFGISAARASIGGITLFVLLMVTENTIWQLPSSLFDVKNLKFFHRAC